MKKIEKQNPSKIQNIAVYDKRTIIAMEELLKAITGN